MRELKNLYCIVGKSGAGKSTVTDALCEQYGLKSVASMTTRPMRYPNEPGHVFVTPEEFHKYDMVAYTMFDGNEYGVPAEMLNDSNFYVIDIEGVKTLRKRYSGKPLCVIYLYISEEEAARRMAARGDTEAMISKRLNNDKTMFKDVEGLAPDYVIMVDNKSQDDVAKELYDIIVEAERQLGIKEQ